MMKTNWKILTIYLLLMSSAHCEVPEKLYLDSSLSVAYSQTNTIDSSDEPKLGQYAVGPSAGWRLWKKFSFGLSSDYRFINQYSEVNRTSGNRRGTRWNIVSPTFFLLTFPYIFKLDAQFLGNHKFSNPGVGGQDRQLTSPFGLRLQGLYSFSDKSTSGQLSDFLKHFQTGLSLEYISFDKQKLGGNESDLAQAIRFWSIGVVLSLNL